jgi:hypothetical protein
MADNSEAGMSQPDPKDTSHQEMLCRRNVIPDIKLFDCDWLKKGFRIG